MVSDLFTGEFLLSGIVDEKNLPLEKQPQKPTVQGNFPVRNSGEKENDLSKKSSNETENNQLISIEEAEKMMDFLSDRRTRKSFITKAIAADIIKVVGEGRRRKLVKEDVERQSRSFSRSLDVLDPDERARGFGRMLLILLVLFGYFFLSDRCFATEDPYQSEIHNSFQNLVPDAPPPGVTTVYSKWVVGLYGVLEADGVYDSTRSFSNWPYNAGVANKNTASGNPATLNSLSGSQLGFDVNGSRFGIMISSPLYQGYRVRGLLEMDFLSTTGTPTPVSAGWDNPSPHLRQLWMDVETPGYGDLLAGKYWSLFGWQPYNLYNSVQIQAGPAETYGLFPQARWYMIGHLEGTLLEPAISIESEEPAFGLPSFVEGLKWAVPGWPGEAMIGATGKGIEPLSVGVSMIETPLSGWTVETGTSASPVGFNELATAYAIDAFLPLIPAKYENPDSTLTLSGEFTSGAGDGFQFPGLTWGMGSYGTGTPGTALPFGTGIVNGQEFVPVQVQSWNINLQYFFSDHARTSVALGIAHVSAGNLASQAGAIGPALLGGGSLSNGMAKYLLPYNRNQYIHADLWHDFTPAVRMGIEAGQVQTDYVGGLTALDNRLMMGWYFLW